MNISSIRNCFAPNVSKTATVNTRKMYNYPHDSVSFSAKSVINNSFGPNIKQASLIGKQIYNKLMKDNDANDVIDVIRKNYPDVEVLPIEQLDIPDKDNYCAFYNYHIGEDFRVVEPRMYVNFNQKLNDSTAKMIFASEVAHEYTHFMQSITEAHKEEFKKHANNDKEYAEVISGLGDSLFAFFDTELQGKILSSNFSMQDSFNIQRYGKIVPRKADMNKNIVIKNSKYSSEKEFKTDINKLFDIGFYEIVQRIPTASENEVLPRLKEKFFEILAEDPNNITKLKNDVRKYCVMQARNEKEAYSTESQLVRNILRTEDSLNIDCFPIYYSMLENAFNNHQ